MSSAITVYIVNAFTDTNEGGSPTGVVLGADLLNEEQMQAIAKKMDTSHTCFAYHSSGDGDRIRVRFFTPAGEILNCGHGSIAVHYTRAKVLSLQGRHIISQEAKEGLQQVEIIATKAEPEIYLRQNEIRFTVVSPDSLIRLLSALSISTTDLADHWPVMLASPGSNRFLVGLRSATHLNNIQPDFERLKKVCADHQSIGCFVYFLYDQSPLKATARMFAPNIGINEDIINGNSSSCLGAYVLLLKQEKELVLSVTQGQRWGREGIVMVKAQEKENHIETFIGGTARIAKQLQFPVKF